MLYDWSKVTAVALFVYGVDPQLLCTAHAPDGEADNLSALRRRRSAAASSDACFWPVALSG